MQNIEKLTTIREANGTKETVETTSGTVKSKDLLATLQALFGEFEGILYLWGNGGRIAIDANASEYKVTSTKRTS